MARRLPQMWHGTQAQIRRDSDQIKAGDRISTPDAPQRGAVAAVPRSSAITSSILALRFCRDRLRSVA